MVDKQQDIDKVASIRRAVDEARAERGVTPTPGAKSEGSCFAKPGGEFANMFDAQLVRTTDGTGEWVMLSDPKIVDGLFDHVSSLEATKKKK